MIELAKEGSPMELRVVQYIDLDNGEDQYTIQTRVDQGPWTEIQKVVTQSLVDYERMKKGEI